jgi:hypothetical protein
MQIKTLGEIPCYKDPNTGLAVPPLSGRGRQLIRLKKGSHTSLLDGGGHLCDPKYKHPPRGRPRKPGRPRSRSVSRRRRKPGPKKGSKRKIKREGRKGRKPGPKKGSKRKAKKQARKSARKRRNPRPKKG